MKEYIDRNKVLRDWPPCDEPADAYQFIRSYPAADVRPVVRGQWENTGSDVWKCSACGYGIMPWNAGVNFCPNCGAMMEG